MLEKRIKHRDDSGTIVRRMNGGAAGDVRAAIDARWLPREPSRVTKRALEEIDHETLWCALHLDTDGVARAFVKSLRERRLWSRARPRAVLDLGAGRSRLRPG